MYVYVCAGVCFHGGEKGDVLGCARIDLDSSESVESDFVGRLRSRKPLATTMAVKSKSINMFDSKAMVEHSEEQPASEAAMMASIMVGRASSSISSSSGGGPPPKTVSQVVNEKKMIVGTVPKKWKIYRSTLVQAVLEPIPFG